MMASRSQSSGCFAALLVASLVAAVSPRPATAQLQFSSADGKQSFKIGILGQLQAESIETGNAQDDSANNLFLRRLRLLGNFKLSDQLTVFFDTDSPNLGKGSPDGSKNNADIFIQDFVVTYAFRKEFQLDGGMLLMAQSYNHNQSAATLLALDYGPYTFVESVPTTARTGRDYGLQARGYLGGDHLEYRAGVFQGVRGVNNTNSFRYAGRLAYYVFGPQIDLFLSRHLARQDAVAVDRRQLRSPGRLRFRGRRPVLGSAGRRRRRRDPAGRLQPDRRRRLHPHPPQAAGRDDRGRLSTSIRSS